jgi:hypothetical protein
MKGILEKMKVTAENGNVNYKLNLSDEWIDMNQFIGKLIRLNHTGRIFCISCGKQTQKAFGQGFCYPCFINSPENAECIVKPELCRGHLGEGRDPEWEKSHHVQPHYVYLSLSSDVKVGVTRNIQVPTRWIDQGAIQAIILAETPYRQLAGEIEVFLKNYLPDKTNWQRMLKNEIAPGTDLTERKKAVSELMREDLKKYITPDFHVYSFHYPVTEYPKKVVSMNFEKMPQIEGLLKGIKGQYLIFDNGRVINLRNQSGYEVELSQENFREEIGSLRLEI